MVLVSDTVHIGEVIAATSQTLTVQSVNPPENPPRFPTPPALGSIIYVNRADGSILPQLPLEKEEFDPFAGNPAPVRQSPDLVFGVVSYVQTSSVDPTRRATALGIRSEDELRRAQPQMFELLTTEWTVLLTSFTDAHGIHQHRLPSIPPRIHSFVYGCDRALTASVTADFGYLRSILSSSGGAITASIDDFAAAAMLVGWEAANFDESYLVSAGKAVLRYTANNYDRFQSIIHRVAPFGLRKQLL